MNSPVCSLSDGRHSNGPAMKLQNDFLDDIDIASPCRAAWDDMNGSDTVRHCGLCQLNVYNLSGMSRDEAEELIQQNEGHVCVRFLRRSDGTVLTQDCPVGLAAVRRKLRRAAMRCAALLALIFLAPFSCGRKHQTPDSSTPPVIEDPVPWMGEVALPAETPQRMLGRLKPIN